MKARTLIQIGKLTAQLLVPVQPRASHDEHQHGSSMLSRSCGERDYGLVSCPGFREDQQQPRVPLDRGSPEGEAEAQAPVGEKPPMIRA